MWGDVRHTPDSAAVGYQSVRRHYLQPAHGDLGCRLALIDAASCRAVLYKAMRQGLLIRKGGLWGLIVTLGALGA